MQVGLGAIGREIARLAHARAGLELVGAVDPDPALVGRDLGQLWGGPANGLIVRASIDEGPGAMQPALVLHATGSHLVEVADQLRSLVGRGLSVLSTCEELAYPFHRHPVLAAELDALARRENAVLLGSGVNPGFVMDKLVATLMAACTAVRAVRVRRVVDAATRRESFQRKLGAGLAVEEFEARRHAGRMGHVGLAESAHLLADVMGVSAKRTLEEALRPVLAERPLASRHVEVRAGQVAGISQLAVIRDATGERVRLELEMVLGAARPEDTVAIDGSPGLEMAIASGVAGDDATAGVVVNCAPLVPALAPGLRTMLDVPVRLGVAAS